MLRLIVTLPPGMCGVAGDCGATLPAGVVFGSGIVIVGAPKSAVSHRALKVATIWYSAAEPASVLVAKKSFSCSVDLVLASGN